MNSFILTKLKLSLHLFVIILFSLVSASASFAEEEIITVMEVKGNTRIETEAILATLGSRVGAYLSAETISEDLKKIFKMGYFRNVKADLSTGDLGPKITFIVEERPFIEKVTFEGNLEVELEALKDVLTVRPFTIFSLEEVKKTELKVEALYEEKGFFLADVSHHLMTESGETILVFDIKEGRKVKIKKINILGNKEISDSQLHKFMETSEGGFFSWLTESGKFDEETLQKDVDLITAFYYNNGFVQIRVEPPKVFMSPDKKWLYVTIRIDEGGQFKIGEIDFAGDLVTEVKEDEGIIKKLKSSKDDFFSRDNLRLDIVNLTDSFGDKGYAFANVSPKTDIDVEKKLVNITFNADKGKIVHIGRINISGNTKTRDKVIRREFKLDEGDLYNGSALRRSRQKIYNLTYFQEVDLVTKPVEGKDELDVNITVGEGPTGTLSVGMGYSSVDGLVGMMQVSQGNLFGRGQKLSLNLEKGGDSSNYSLSFTEPYLFDSSISAGFSVFNNERDYTDYTTRNKGYGLSVGRPVGEYGRATLRYNYKEVDIADVSADAPDEYLDYADTVTSSIGATFKRDTRDNYMNPTSGNETSLYLEYAGDFNGGKNFFYKTVLNTSWFFPAFAEHVIMLHGRIGYADGLQGQPLHFDEKFRLGGINTIRGFDNRSVGPEEDGIVIGGNKEILFNVEYVFDIAKDAGLKGLFFYDAGNAFAVSESYDLGNLRESVGYGFRWYSPVGPLRLENGYILDPEPGEKKSRWEFSIGTFF